VCKPGYQRSRPTLSQLLATESSPRGFSTSQRSRPASRNVTNSVLYFVMTRAGARAHIAMSVPVGSSRLAACPLHAGGGSFESCTAHLVGRPMSSAVSADYTCEGAHWGRPQKEETCQT